MMGEPTQWLSLPLLKGELGKFAIGDVMSPLLVFHTQNNLKVFHEIHCQIID